MMRIMMVGGPDIFIKERKFLHYTQHLFYLAKNALDGRIRLPSCGFLDFFLYVANSPFLKCLLSITMTQVYIVRWRYYLLFLLSC